MYDRHKSSSVILLLCFTFVVFQQQVVMLPCLPSSLATLYLGLFLSAQKGKQQVNSVFRHILHSFLSSTYGRGCVEHFVWKYIRRTTWQGLFTHHLSSSNYSPRYYNGNFNQFFFLCPLLGSRAHGSLCAHRVLQIGNQDSRSCSRRSSKVG